MPGRFVLLRRWAVCAAAGLAGVPWPAGLQAQTAAAAEDPMAQQARAFEMLDAMRERFWRLPRFDPGSLEQGTLAAAEPLLDQSNRTLEARGDPRAVKGLIRQGKVRGLMPDAPGQLALARRAVKLAMAGDDAELQVLALTAQSHAELQTGDTAQALIDAAAAVQRAEPLADRKALAQALAALGAAQRSQRDVFAAIDSAQRGVEVARLVPDRVELHDALENRFSAYLDAAAQCRTQAAFDACADALDKAAVDSREAAAVARALGYTVLVSMEDARNTRLAVDRQGLQHAQQSARLLQEMARRTPYARGAADVLSSERVVMVRNSSASSLTTALKDLLNQSLGMEKFAGRLSDPETYSSMALVKEWEGEHDEALSWYLKATDALDRDRRRIADAGARSAFVGPRAQIYQMAAMQLLQHRRHAEALEMMERSRSRVLADMLASRPLTLGDGRQQALYAEAAALRARIADRQARMFSATGFDPGRRGEAGYAADERALREDEAAYEALRRRIAAEAPALGALVESRGADHAALKKAMREEDFELLQYHYAPGGLVIWHSAADGEHVLSVLTLQEHLRQTTARLSDSLRRPDRPFDEAAARELYYRLIGPIRSRLHSRRLVVIPMPEQANLPFQALVDPQDGRFLGDTFDITYAPSVAVLLALQRARPLVPSDTRVLAWGLPGLPGAADEIASIRRVLGGQGVFRVDRPPRKAEVLRGVADADVVHLAVHGQFSKADAMASFLELGADAGADTAAAGSPAGGRLTATEMFALPLARKPLVVLSACETGISATTTSGEMLGMSRALLFAGANALLLSQWRVDSEATAHWMQAFYQAATAMPLAQAARVASQAVRADPETRHPYYWAPFLLTAR